MDSFFKQQVYTKIVLGGSAIKNNQFIPSQAVLFALELYQRFSPLLDEPARRQFLACIVEQGGYGAQSYVQAVTGMNPHALERGHDEIQDKNLDTSSHRRQRKPGGGRKSIESIHPEIFDDLRMIIEDSTYGDPCKPLSYTTMSEAKIVEALDQEYGIHISDTKVGELLEPIGYSRQNNQKMLQAGKESPDRDKQQDGRRVSESRKSCPFRRYEEEGKPGQFQERRNRILSERKTETGARP